jgi:copper chaperone
MRTQQQVRPKDNDNGNNKAMTKHYQYDVTMSCSGCSGAVTRAVGKLEGVERVDAHLDTQKVDVYANEGVTYDAVLAKISKTGKTVNGGRVVA